MNNSSSSSITALVPGGVVTTQNISTVIKPKENNNSMQFVKIQTPELSKKAVEQIRVAQESKITKDQIKEVEEEWQSNLLNWKSKRRQQFVGTHSNDNQDEQNNNQNDANENGRKIKTFAEMIEERTKTGNRLNFHLERYIGSSESDNYESEQDNLDKTDFVDKEISQLSLSSNNSNSLNHYQHRLHPNHIDIVTRTKEVSSAARFEDNASDNEEDEEDEQEEEQKHLQRIAFVAKLKAFEKMTQPSMKEPKFVPKTTKAPPPPPLQSSSPLQSQLPPLPTHSSSPIQSQPPPPPPKSSLSPLSLHPPRSPPSASLSPQLMSPEKSSNSSSNSPQSSNSPPASQSPHQSPAPPSSPPIVPSRSSHIQSSPPLAPPPILTPPMRHRIQNQQQQPQPPLKDDKCQDRTMLSVSGKKRCSSCKEELGRGAAAFVIESLNLVYHTNCFRCSVCHVNLSNGFRGVDVRVHAGTLHCQNCYSKDGLNYSRV